MQSEKGESLGLSENFLFIFLFFNNSYCGTEELLFVEEFYDSKVFAFLFIFLCV